MTDATKEILVQVLETLKRHERQCNQLQLNFDCILAALPKEQHDKVGIEMQQRGLDASTRVLRTLGSFDAAIQQLQKE